MNSLFGEGTRLARRDAMRMGAWASLAALVPADFARAEPAGDASMRNIAQFMARCVGPGKYPGLVCSLGLPGQQTRFALRGDEGFTDADPVTPDSLFRIYSMTKPITGMAAMMLVAEGKLGLDQPLADILPRFARMQVQVTPDGPLGDVRPAKRPILIRHLMTHTAGLGYVIVQQGPLRKAYADAGLVAGRVTRLSIPGISVEPSISSLEAFADKLAELPLVYDPGTQWSYSVGLDLLGRVIEVVSGEPFDQFLQRRLFEPCGMTSTWFQVPRSEAHRLTTNYGAIGENLFPIDRGSDSIFLDKPAFPFGGSGLVSSPRDYDRFLTMLANYGLAGGTRVMSEAAVRAGTGNLLPTGVLACTVLGPPCHFGAGGRVGIGAEAGIFGWAGAAGTVATVDMRHGVRSSIFVQFMPPTSSQLLRDYQTALRADVQASFTRS